MALKKIYYEKSARIEWSTFESLMEAIDLRMKEENDYKLTRLASFQSIIACGCHLGPLPKELLSIRWQDILFQPFYSFKDEPHRLPVELPSTLQWLVRRNFEIVNPFSTNGYIVTDSTTPRDAPLRSMKFNKIVSKLFTELGFMSENISPHTFRKAYFRKVWDEKGQTEEATQFLMEQLEYDKLSTLAYIKQ